MQSLNVAGTSLSGVLVLTPRYFRDDRGFFVETWSSRVMRDAGLDFDFVQDNHSHSRDVGTIRGLHFQSPPHAQAKLVRCTRGAIWDVAVDIRLGSPSYGQWVGTALTAENGRQLLIPRGFLHGFVTREPDTEVQYKCTDYYAPECDGSVRWDSLGISWDVPNEPVVSGRDATAQLFSDFETPFTYEESRP